MEDSLRPRDGLHLLAVAGESATQLGLREVEKLTGALGILRAVIRVLPARQRAAAGDDLAASVQAELELTEKAAFADWVISALQTKNWPATEVLRTQVGFVETVARVAKDMDAGLVVLTGVSAAEIGSITDLAHACERPVLLVRSTGKGARGVLVATSLADNGIRVFRFGAELARRLGAPVTLAHNALTKGAEGSAGREVAHAELESRASLIGAETGVEVDVVVSRAESPEVAIVDLAAQRNCQLLVLGSFPRSWLTGWLIPSVSAPVVERVASSVVVLPLMEP